MPSRKKKKKSSETTKRPGRKPGSADKGEDLLAEVDAGSPAKKGKNTRRKSWSQRGGKINAAGGAGAGKLEGKPALEGGGRCLKSAGEAAKGGSARKDTRGKKKIYKERELRSRHFLSKTSSYVGQSSAVSQQKGRFSGRKTEGDSVDIKQKKSGSRPKKSEWEKKGLGGIPQPKRME